jgi:hypothetical protein
MCSKHGSSKCSSGRQCSQEQPQQVVAPLLTVSRACLLLLCLVAGWLLKASHMQRCLQAGCVAAVWKLRSSPPACVEYVGDRQSLSMPSVFVTVTAAAAATSQRGEGASRQVCVCACMTVGRLVAAEVWHATARTVGQSDPRQEITSSSSSSSRCHRVCRGMDYDCCVVSQ